MAQNWAEFSEMTYSPGSWGSSSPTGEVASEPVQKDLGTTSSDDDRTIAHHLDSAAFNIKHSQRHIETAMQSPQSSAFNLQHAAKHLGETLETIEKLHDSVARQLPGVAAEIGKLNGASAKYSK